ncbi:MAG: 4-hydroxy-3-methylbut-2-en-1-yl diphosphate synthase [Proteobacteria bacterium]|nr:4-hydroxy-3-methylbut-2-en-1-yl diphosphate synthase [Pseudomonadota bacterium]
MNKEYLRRKTRTVMVGKVGVGSAEPVRIQSMLTSETTDLDSVMLEIQALHRASCEMIRITIPNRKALDAIPEVRRRMSEEGIERPLIADIHFNPQLAVDSCEFFEKVRINPGNYADRKKFEIREYSDLQYAEELERIEETLLPLVKNLKTYQRCLRIGTNHGSLSDRVMNRFGDSPEGMVQSALEFLRIFEKHDFYDTILSMKSSNPLVMKEAYRLLVMRMEEESMDYPLHLGVTEAGNGSEGRIKSAVGIGGLLCQGLGDTIRVSLTEPAENEIPAAKAILGGVEKLIERIATDLGENERFEEKAVSETTISPNQNQSTLRIQSGKTSVRSILLKPSGCKIGDRETFKLLSWKTEKEFTDPKKVFDAKLDRSDGEQVLLLNEQEIETGLDKTILDHLKSKLLVLEVSNPLYTIRNLNQRLEGKAKPAAIGFQLPIIESMEDHLGLAAELGELISSRELHALICRDGDPESLSARFAQNLLQATRVRMFQADFISCPSCGRTFFDLQQTTEQIKRKTAHLTGVKIAVMGCVVNGPGEMADADYGYVGAGPGKIHLYRGQQCVQRNIPSHDAVDKLIDLIRSEGRWIEPVEASAA